MTRPGRVLSLGLGVLMATFPLHSPASTAPVTNGAGLLSGPGVPRPGRVVHEFGTVTLAMIEQLKAGVWLEVSLPREEGDVHFSLSPREVIALRRQYPEVSTLAGSKMALIQGLTLGAAPEFVEVGRMFALFYEGVARDSWSIVLEWRLERAEKALQALVRQTKARNSYLDDFERRMKGAPATGNALPWLEKTRMESYLDEAEKRFDKPE